MPRCRHRASVSRTACSPGAEIDITTTLAARRRNGSASATARADSRDSFHAIRTVSPIVGELAEVRNDQHGPPGLHQHRRARDRLANAACGIGGQRLRRGPRGRHSAHARSRRRSARPAGALQSTASSPRGPPRPRKRASARACASPDSCRRCVDHGVGQHRRRERRQLARRHEVGAGEFGVELPRKRCRDARAAQRSGRCRRCGQAGIDSPWHPRTWNASYSAPIRSGATRSRCRPKPCARRDGPSRRTEEAAMKSPLAWLALDCGAGDRRRTLLLARTHAPEPRRRRWPRPNRRRSPPEAPQILHPVPGNAGGRAALPPLADQRRADHAKPWRNSSAAKPSHVLLSRRVAAPLRRDRRQPAAQDDGRAPHAA